MKILREGDRGHSLAPERGRVEVVYKYRTIELEQSKAVVRNDLVGVDAATGEVLTVPAQSTPKLKATREATKERVLSIRMPRELEDALHLVADRCRTTPGRFAPALIRYYLAEASSDPSVARRLCKSSTNPLAAGTCRANLRLRVKPELFRWMSEFEAADADVTKSDLVRGAIVAAKEDVLDVPSEQRRRELEVIARAI